MVAGVAAGLLSFQVLSNIERLSSKTHHVDCSSRDGVEIRNRARGSKGNRNQLAVGEIEKISQSVD